MKNEQDTFGRIMTHLVPWLQKRMPGAQHLSISGIQKPGMGLSNETFLFDLAWEEQGKRITKGMVLRAAPLDHKVFPEYHLNHQFLIMRALRQSNVPVPEMFWQEEAPEVIGTPFYIMERLSGTMPKDYPSYHGSGVYFDATPEQRSLMWWRALEMLARTNMADWRKLGLDFLGVPQAGTGPIDRQLAYWSRFLDWIKDDPSESYPVLEKALQWLRDNAYVPERVCLCWGDARMGNVLYGEPDFNVVAVLDWEMAFLGDPEADLAWFVFMDWYLSAEYSLPRLPGSPGRDETIRRYEELTGWKVRNFDYNEVFAAMRFGMILISVLKKMKRQGVPIADDMYHNNCCTRRIADVLGLEAPGEHKKTVNVKEDLVTIQFNFTGPGGSDWYIVSEQGRARRHEGTVKDPTCTVRATAEDWRCLQNGTLNQIEAWKTGRLVVEGDLKVMIELKDEISRLQSAEARV
ncbi:MAG TPA: phosphotransferase [Spirochaetota bacterium]|nr:phosphotransferase [Spirochaetota bacterium]HQH98087.1 phosphotransferase [Spirochaetota bacterium]